MTSRERVLRALSHKTPDCVPLDLGGTESSGITVSAYCKLRQFCGLNKGKVQVFDVYQQIVKIENDLRNIIKPDTIPLLIEPKQWKLFILEDGTPCEIPVKWNPERGVSGDLEVKNDKNIVIARMPKGGMYFESVNPPLIKVETPLDLNDFAEELENFDWAFFTDETFSSIAVRAKSLFENTELAVVANLQLHLLAAGQNLRGYENFMMDLLINKPLCHAIFERLLAAYFRRIERYFEHTAPYIQIVLVNDDLGTQNSPMLSLECYKEMIWPYQKRLFEFVKKKSNSFLLFHSCGSIYPFIPLLIDAGIDVLNPVQVSATNMNSRQLKSEFGKDITFWGGGCDTQNILNKGTPGDICEEVKKRIDDLAADGGFVFTQVHNIQPDVLPENIMVMYEAFEKYRKY